ncbi:NAD(P)/FAD-dependent oxidoreductase [Cryobacterium sp. PH31-L1]|uniref:flavin-containing monooxygenase n=1 Tax=Cryobacterium sp. PH31-L1 TaxID=3046199 RepID=UPI0024B917FF|nr:NAD(P)/FAD-dependent oxidoreductase [Cryobacterium sp. PH31-L1]MDJ0378474.1 NAD(P)/FAD-dependent oxidoreductase [Cryobacterium sp. PH31-L1]
MTNELPTRYLIIGAGVNGLIAARAFRRYGIDVDIIERHTRLGGLWDMDNPGTPMYETCSMISSRVAGGFVGFPMSDDLPMYPRWSDLYAYIQDFAHEFQLDELCEFGLSVVTATPVDTAGGRYWNVLLSTGETRRYRGIYSAIGSQWQPLVPNIPGLDSFTGRAIHAKDYRSTEELNGKRVLVVGAGNSGVDIASDAAFHADAASLSTRRPYYFFPKQIFGVALPDLFDGRAQITPRPWMDGLEPADFMDVVLSTVGDLSAYGLPIPDGPVGETHPIVSNTVLHAFSHGLLTRHPDLDRIDGSTVYFDDGTSEDVDVIVFATGYEVHYDFLPDGLVEYRRGHPHLHLALFFPGVEGIYSGGSLHAAVGAGWTVFDYFANFAAADAHATLTGENAEGLRRFKTEYDPDMTAGFPFVDTPRNENQYDAQMLLATIPQAARTEFGIAVPTGFDDEDFYASLPRRSRMEAQVTAA